MFSRRLYVKKVLKVFIETLLVHIRHGDLMEHNPTPLRSKSTGALKWFKKPLKKSRLFKPGL